MRSLEGPGEVVRCDGRSPARYRRLSPPAPPCATRQEAFFAALDPLTIADLAAPPTRAILLTLSSRPTT